MHRRQRPLTVNDWELISTSRPAFGAVAAPAAEDLYVSEELDEALQAARRRTTVGVELAVDVRSACRRESRMTHRWALPILPPALKSRDELTKEDPHSPHTRGRPGNSRNPQRNPRHPAAADPDGASKIASTGLSATPWRPARRLLRRQRRCSPGCTGEVDCDLTASGLPDPASVSLDPTGLQATAQWSLCPLLDAGTTTGDHMAPIQAAIDSARASGTASKPNHYTTS